MNPEADSNDSRNVNNQKFMHLMTKVREIMMPDAMHSRIMFIHSGNDALRAFDIFEDKLECIRRYMEEARQNHPNVYFQLRKTDHRAWLTRVVAENTFQRTAGGFRLPIKLGEFSHLLSACPEPIRNRAFIVAAYIKTHDQKWLPSDDLKIPNKTFTKLVMQALNKKSQDELNTWKAKLETCTENDSELLQYLFNGIETIEEERKEIIVVQTTLPVTKKIKIDNNDNNENE